MTPNASSEQLARFTAGDQAQKRWSDSTIGTAHEMDQSRTWEAPPVPPIPTEEEAAAWRRSSKRASHASQITGSRPVDTGNGASFLGRDSEIKTTRPFVEVMSTDDFHRYSRLEGQKTAGDERTDLNWMADPSNPRNWPKRRRWTLTVTSGSVAFTVALASSIVAPACLQPLQFFDIPSVVSIFPFSLFILGLAYGPALSTLIGETIGRKAVYISSFPLFTIVILASGLVRTSAGISICRFLAGLFAGPGLYVGPVVIADVWNQSERTLPLILFNLVLLLGSILGLVIGGYVAESKGQGWDEYTVLFFAAACLAPILLFSETAEKSIIRRKRRESIYAPVDMAILRLACIQPLTMILTEPIVTLLSIYDGLNFAILYAAFAAFPKVFSRVYSFNVGSQGVVFASMAVGLIISFGLLVTHHMLIYRPRISSWQGARFAEAEQARSPKHRGNRSSKTSIPVTLSQGTSRGRNASSPYDSKLNLSGISLALSLKRAKTPDSTVPRERNIHIAVTAAKYLNSVPANEGRHIIPERIMFLLNHDPTYGDFCIALESYNLKFDRVLLAKSLADAMPEQMHAGSGSQTPALARSLSMHRQAAAAALDRPATPHDLRSMGIQPFARGLLYAGASPPPEWRLWPALPGSILVSIALFIFGWTANAQTAYMAPVVAMAIFACGLLLVFTSSSLYILDCYGPKSANTAAAGGMVVRYLLSFIFSLFALQMYHAVGIPWSTGVYGFISVGCGCVPWCLLVLGPGMRRRSGYRQRSS